MDVVVFLTVVIVGALLAAVYEIGHDAGFRKGFNMTVNVYPKPGEDFQSIMRGVVTHITKERV